MNQLKTQRRRRAFLLDVQTSRPVTASGCQKTGAPYPIQSIRHCYIVIGLNMILDIWGRNDQTNIAPSSEKHTHNKKKGKKTKNWKSREGRKKGRFADTRCYRALAAYTVLHLSQHTDLLLIDCQEVYIQLDRYKATRLHLHTEKKKSYKPSKRAVLVIIIIRVERRLNILI